MINHDDHDDDDHDHLHRLKLMSFPFPVAGCPPPRHAKRDKLDSLGGDLDLDRATALSGQPHRSSDRAPLLVLMYSY